MPGYGAVGRLKVLGTSVTYVTAKRIAAVSLAHSSSGLFCPGVCGALVTWNSPAMNRRIALTGGLWPYNPLGSGYFYFKDYTGGWPPVLGWAHYHLDLAAGDLTVYLDEWYYNDTPGAYIWVGDKGSPAAVPFDFNPLQGAALGVPIFIGLRQLKRRKAKLNTMVSVKGKEKIHPLALIGMGAAGVLKWRAQKDKDAA